MLRENASALVAAGMLSVLVFPVLTVVLDRPAPALPVEIPRQERRRWRPLRTTGATGRDRSEAG
jgi:hypothetical protein